jgi:hypothetical protein
VLCRFESSSSSCATFLAMNLTEHRVAPPRERVPSEHKPGRTSGRVPSRALKWCRSPNWGYALLLDLAELDLARAAGSATRTRHRRVGTKSYDGATSIRLKNSPPEFARAASVIVLAVTW